MKKLILLSSLVLSSVTFAQEKSNPRQQHGRMVKPKMMKEISAEQIATLKTKQMTLDLDLTESQQKKIHALNLKSAQKTKSLKFNDSNAKVKMTSDQKYEKMNANLDQKIKIKKDIKSILTKDQYLKWESHQKEMIMMKKKHYSKKQLSK
mgnify:CR=1 FL=1